MAKDNIDNVTAENMIDTGATLWVLAFVSIRDGIYTEYVTQTTISP